MQRQTYLDDYRSTLSGAGARQVTTTDANVALRRQQDRQPNRRGMEHGRQVVGETKVRVTPAVRNPVVFGADCKEPDVHRQGPETGQQVGESYGDQNGVGGRTHAGPDKHDADEKVADDYDENQQRNEVAVDERAVRNVIQKERSATR